jgi:DNA-binding GntR family transcriptional regulator
LALAYVFAVGRAVAHWDDERDRTLIARAAEFAAATDAAEHQRQAFAFHATVVSAARSPRLRSLLRAMPRLVPGDFFAVVPQALEYQSERLDEIAAALRDRDTDTAARSYADLFGRNADLVVEAFRTRGLFDPTPENHRRNHG